MRRGLIEPYDIPVIVALVVGNLLLVIIGGYWLKFQSWMPWNIFRFFKYGVEALCLLGLIRLLLHIWQHHGVDMDSSRRILSTHLGSNILLSTLRFCVFLELLLLVYTTLKQRIPCLHPILYDVGLIRLEEFIHFGWNPAWAMARYNFPKWWLRFLDWAYISWFHAKALVIVYILTLPDQAKRDRFLISYMSMWIMCVLLGLMIPSLGPCYIDPGLFPPKGMPVAARIQNNLKTHYLYYLLPGKNCFLWYGYGLMALPSLHVAAVALYALYGWGEGSFIRWLTIVYALLIFIGSVTTGWHYAIDGYAAVVIVLGARYFAAWLQKHLEGSNLYS